MYNLDPDRRGFGYDIHGAMAEYVKVPAACCTASRRTCRWKSRR